MPDAQRAMVEGRPAWATGAFATAVFGGALGAFLLLLRKSAAYYVFLASLFGVIVQATAYLRSGGATAFGAGEVVMYVLMPLVVAAYRHALGKSAGRRQWSGSRRCPSRLAKVRRGRMFITDAARLILGGGRRKTAWIERRPILVSDRSTLGGLTQFATQFGFSGSSTRP